MLIHLSLQGSHVQRLAACHASIAQRWSGHTAEGHAYAHELDSRICLACRTTEDLLALGRTTPLQIIPVGRQHAPGMSAQAASEGNAAQQSTTGETA